MYNKPSLSFLSPEIFDDAMVVDEIDFGHSKMQPLTPFKGSKFIVYPNQSSPVDIHDVKECWFIASGTGILTYRETSGKSVKAGDVLLFDSQESHKIFNNGTIDLVVFSVWW